MNYVWRIFVNFQCVQDLVFSQIITAFEAFRSDKLIQQVADNLNFKGLSFFIHPVYYLKVVLLIRTRMTTN